MLSLKYPTGPRAVSYKQEMGGFIFPLIYSVNVHRAITTCLSSSFIKLSSSRYPPVQQVYPYAQDSGVHHTILRCRILSPPIFTSFTRESQSSGRAHQEGQMGIRTQSTQAQGRCFSHRSQNPKDEFLPQTGPINLYHSVSQLSHCFVCLTCSYVRKLIFGQLRSLEGASNHGIRTQKTSESKRTPNYPRVRPDALSKVKDRTMNTHQDDFEYF